MQAVVSEAVRPSPRSERSERLYEAPKAPSPLGAQRLEDRHQLRIRLLVCAVGADDVVRSSDFFRDGPLRGDAQLRTFPGEAISMDDPADLCGRLAGDDNHFVVIPFTMRFVEQRDIGHGKRRLRRQRLEKLVDPATNNRVDDRFQIPSGLAIPEHNLSKPCSVERARLGKDTRPESRYQGREPGRTGGNGFTRENIGVDDGDAGLLQTARDVTLSRRDSTG